MNNLVSLFSRNEMVYSTKSKPVISFEMNTGKTGDMAINLNIGAMKIDI